MSVDNKSNDQTNDETVMVECVCCEAKRLATTMNSIGWCFECVKDQHWCDFRMAEDDDYLKGKITHEELSFRKHKYVVGLGYIRDGYNKVDITEVITIRCNNFV